MESNILQYVDIEVTKKKFRKEIQEFHDLEEEYRKRGVICREIREFSIILLFAAPNLKPPPIAFAVNIDYTNWDCEPPSLKIIDPFTGQLMKGKDVAIQFLQWNHENNQPQPLLVGLDIPFLCVPGVREYHHHPYHSGDSWMLYRTRGEGKLCDIIEKLIKHSTSLIMGYSINVNGVLIPFINLPFVYDTNKIPK